MWGSGALENSEYLFVAIAFRSNLTRSGGSWQGPIYRSNKIFCPLNWMQTNNLHIIIFTNPSAQAGYDKTSIFKPSLTGLNSEFSFSKTYCLTKAEEHSLPYYLPIAGGRIFLIHTFPKGISAMWNAISLDQDLNSCHRVYFPRR